MPSKTWPHGKNQIEDTRCYSAAAPALKWLMEVQCRVILKFQFA